MSIAVKKLGYDGVRLDITPSNLHDTIEWLEVGTEGVTVSDRWSWHVDRESDLADARLGDNNRWFELRLMVDSSMVPMGHPPYRVHARIVVRQSGVMRAWLYYPPPDCLLVRLLVADKLRELTS